MHPAAEATAQCQIFEVLHKSTLIKKHGGGCGYNFSKVRPEGDIVGGIPELVIDGLAEASKAEKVAKIKALKAASKGQEAAAKKAAARKAKSNQTGRC